MVYFIYKRHDECLKHKSTYCGCKLNIPKEEIEISINNYIDIYKSCSTIFEIINGKIKFISLRRPQNIK